MFSLKWRAFSEEVTVCPPKSFKTDIFCNFSYQMILCTSTCIKALSLLWETVRGYQDSQ